MMKMGNAGHGREAYDPKTGKFISDGHANKYFPNPDEAKKISEGVAPAKIARESAESMESPVGNLGKYAEPGRGEPGRSDVLRGEFGLDSDSGSSAFGDKVVDALSGLGASQEAIKDFLGDVDLDSFDSVESVIKAFRDR